MIIAYFGGAGAFGGKNLTPPTVSVGTYTYNGKAQGPTVSGVDTKKMTVTGATATEPGTYTLTISLKKKSYTWSDTKSNAAKTYSYTINKITVANPTVSNTSLTYTGGSIGPTISYNTTYASASGTTNATNVGSYTFSIALKDTSHYRWSSGDSNTKSYSWSIGKQPNPATIMFSTSEFNPNSPGSGVYVVSASNPTVTMPSAYYYIYAKGFTISQYDSKKTSTPGFAYTQNNGTLLSLVTNRTARSGPSTSTTASVFNIGNSASSSGSSGTYSGWYGGYRMMYTDARWEFPAAAGTGYDAVTLTWTIGSV